MKILVKESGLPVTAKIRLLQTDEQTVELCKMIESCGVAAITVHCRYVFMQNNENQSALIVPKI